MIDVLRIARLALREAVRRRVLPVVVVLSLVFLVLFWIAVGVVRDSQSKTRAVDGFGPVLDSLAAGFLVGMATFATLFLGATLAIFLTSGSIRGDAERGLLQPLIVRPVGRVRVLAGRWLAATIIAAPYAFVLELGAMGILRWRADYVAPNAVVASLELALAVSLVALLALASSVVLSQIASGIGSFMAVGAGLVGGLVGQIGDALDSKSLEGAADVIATALPFQGLYEDVLDRLTPEGADAIQLGPLGGASQAPGWFAFWTAAWAIGIAGFALWRFHRRDL